MYERLFPLNILLSLLVSKLMFYIEVNIASHLLPDIGIQMSITPRGSKRICEEPLFILPFLKLTVNDLSVVSRGSRIWLAQLYLGT